MTAPAAAMETVHPAKRTGVLAVLGWAVFVMLVLYAVFLGGSFPGIYLPVVRWWTLWIVAGGLLVWAILAIRDPAWRPRSAIWPAFVVPLAVLATTTATSRYPRLGIEYVAWSTLLVALYLFLVRILARPFVRTRIGTVMAALCLGIGLTYIVAVVRHWLDWWGLVGHLTAPPLRPFFEGLTFGNPSAVLTVTFLALLPALAALPTDRRAKAAIGGLLIVVTAIVAVLTGSRAGWFAIAVTLGVVGTAWLLSGDHRGRLGDALRDRRVRIAILAGAGVVALAAVVLLPGILLRASSTSDGGRLAYFTTAIRMFVEQPLTGLGPGAWPALRISFTNPGELDYTVPHAHSIYLQTLAEAGLLGAVAGIVVIACLGWLVVGAIRDPDGARRRMGWAAALALVYAAAHHVFDFYANMPAVLLLLAVPIAWLDATAERRLPLPAIADRAVKSLSRVAGPALALVTVLAVLVLGRAESIAQTEQQAVDQMTDGSWLAGAAAAAAAVTADPDLPSYQVTNAIARAANEDWAGSASAFERAANVDNLPQSWLGLAWASHKAGASDEDVRRAISMAMRTGVQQPAVAYAAGWLSDRIGDIETADAAYVAALTALPSLAGDPSWTTDPVLAARWPSILDTAISTSPGSAWELALVAGDPDRARSLTTLTSDPEAVSLAIDAWTGDAAARDALRARASDSPMDGFATSWLARVAARAGDQAEADRYRRWSDMQDITTFNGYEVRVEPNAMATSVGAGSGVRFYGSYGYRRQTPQDLVAPGLPRLVFVDETGAG